MMNIDEELEWFHRRTEGYRSGQNDTGGLVKELESKGKLGQEFSSMDCLDEVYIGDGMVH
jgi:hypothetical protein